MKSNTPHDLRLSLRIYHVVRASLRGGRRRRQELSDILTRISSLDKERKKKSLKQRIMGRIPTRNVWKFWRSGNQRAGDPRILEDLSRSCLALHRGLDARLQQKWFVPSTGGQQGGR
jgi:hypothetical protein